MKTDKKVVRTPYRVTYNHGLMNPVTVYAKDEHEAKLMGHAEYLRNSCVIESHWTDHAPDWTVRAVEPIL